MNISAILPYWYTLSGETGEWYAYLKRKDTVSKTIYTSIPLCYTILQSDTRCHQTGSINAEPNRIYDE